MRTFGYIRVSRYRTEEQLSPESQRERLAAYCKTRRWTLHDVFSDLDVSGATFERPGWSELVETVESGDVIVCNEYTRIGRNLRQTLERIEELGDRGVEIVSLEQDLDTTTAAGKLQLQVLLVIAEFQRNRVREIAKQTHAYLAESGRWKGGSLPYGYGYRDPDGGDFEVVVDEDEAEAVRLAFKLRDAGNGIKPITQTLNEAGYRGKVKGNRLLPTTVRQILRNRSYVGERLVRGKTYPLNIPPLVDRDLWERVQALDVRDSGTRAPLHLLTGLLTCGRCGGGLSYHKGDYICRQTRVGGDCQGVYIDATFAERVILDRFFEKVESLGYREGAQASTPKTARRGKTLERKIAEIEAKQDRLLNAYLEKKIEPEVFERNSAKLTEGLEALKHEAARLEAVKKLPPKWEGDIREDFKLFTLDEKREALKRFIERATVRPGRGDRISFKWAG